MWGLGSTSSRGSSSRRTGSGLGLMAGGAAAGALGGAALGAAAGRRALGTPPEHSQPHSPWSSWSPASDEIGSSQQEANPTGGAHYASAQQRSRNEFEGPS